MRCEIPVLTRCCCCLPLRHGLLAWSYFKQIWIVLLLIGMICKVCSDYRHFNAGTYVFTILVILLLAVEMIFHILFIIGAHTKDYRKMRIFYRYSVVIICLMIAVICIHIGLFIYYSVLSPFFFVILYYITLPLLGISVLTLVIQGYLIVLVRSEFLKLKNNSQFEFVNQVAEQKCTGNIDFKSEYNV